MPSPETAADVDAPGGHARARPLLVSSTHADSVPIGSAPVMTGPLLRAPEHASQTNFDRRLFWTEAVAQTVGAPGRGGGGSAVV
jgi:hypothetical protein